MVLFLSMFAFTFNSFAMADPEDDGPPALEITEKERPKSPDRDALLAEAMRRREFKEMGLPYKSLEEVERERQEEKKEKEKERERQRKLKEKKRDEDDQFGMFGLLPGD